MKFRSKITLCMITIISFFFALGSSALIFSSFEDSLSREESLAQDSYRMILATLEMVYEMEDGADYQDITRVLDQLTAQDIHSWSALQLSSSSKTLYHQGTKTLVFLDLSSEIDSKHNAYQIFSGIDHHHYLQISGKFLLGDIPFFLDVAYDITPLYRTRQQQQQLYMYIFFILFIACSIISFLLSYFLTKPLLQLSYATKEFARGNYSYRSSIPSQDEIGAVSRDFDSMARQLEESIHQLESSLERQNQFLGNFTHELKTPMTSIIGYADLLRTQDLTPSEQTDAANYIFSEGKRLERLSLKLLQLNEVNQQVFFFVEASPARIIINIVDHLRASYLEKGISFQLSLQEGDCWLEPDLFYSLMINLIDNARKSFDFCGCIQISCQRKDSFWNISIADNGKGIPPDALQHLTEAFYRVDKSRSRSLGGVGLGLSLCKKIVEIHHGSMDFASTQDVGTTVTISLKGDTRYEDDNSI